MRHYEIGKTYPLEQGRGIIGAKLAKPVWHVLTVLPMKERAACEMLKQKGVHAFYPQREKTHHQRGKKYTRSYPIVTQIIYAKFRHAPQWDVMKSRRLLTGVFCSNGWPIEIPGEIIKQVRGLQTEIDKLEEARAELKRLRAGDKAEFTDGPLSGFLVDIRDVQGGEVWFECMTGEGRSFRGSTRAALLERKA